MKHRLFDSRLYLDALRQLRTLGITATVLLVLEAVLIPVGEFISIRNWQGGPIIQSVELYEKHPLLILCFCLLAPLMTLYIFDFMNRRASSDFYHSLPNSRASLFLSLLAAVLTWTLFAMLASTVVSVVSLSFLGRYFSLNLLGSLVFFFNVFAAAVLVATSVSVAMSVSGTTFTNIVVSLLLIFMPRLLIVVFSSLLGSIQPVVDGLPIFPDRKSTRLNSSH